jgi:long-chain acyl-CoA synthetase
VTVKRFLWNPWRTASLEPGRLAVIAGDAVVTFRELCDRADLILCGLRSAAVADGAVIATDIPPGPDFFALALAALKGGFGIFGVPVGPNSPDRETLAGDSSAVLAVTGGCDGTRFGALPTLTVAELTAPGPSPASRPGGSGGRRAGFLVFATSGTTGRPAVVARTRPPYSYRGVAVIPEHGAGPASGPHLMTSPAYHLGTVGPALYALQAGSAVIVQQRWSPRLFCGLADEHQADSAFVNPHQLTSLVDGQAAPARPLSALFHGGSPVPPGVKHRAIGLFGNAVREFYGTSHGVISEVSAREWLRRPGTVGRPLPGVRVTVSRGGGTAPAGVLGDIRARYRPVGMNGRECACVETGDIGYVDEAGYLFVVGRKDSSGTDRPALLEQAIRRLPGVCDVAVVPDCSGPGQVACYVEPSAGTPEAIRCLVGDLACQMGMDDARIVVAPRGHLPRTASGKLWRARLTAAPARWERAL